MKARTLLTEPGRGWLRWGYGTYSYQEIIDPAIGGPWHDAQCAPPLRRAWLWVKGRGEWVLRGGGWCRYRVARGVEDYNEWDRLTWREFVPTRGDLADLRDPEWPGGYR